MWRQPEDAQEVGYRDPRECRDPDYEGALSAATGVLDTEICPDGAAENSDNPTADTTNQADWSRIHVPLPGSTPRAAPPRRGIHRAFDHLRFLGQRDRRAEDCLPILKSHSLELAVHSLIMIPFAKVIGTLGTLLGCPQCVSVFSGQFCPIPRPPMRPANQHSSRARRKSFDFRQIRDISTMNAPYLPYS
jgi:hypothetical protein